MLMAAMMFPWRGLDMAVSHFMILQVVALAILQVFETSVMVAVCTSLLERSQRRKWVHIFGRLAAPVRWLGSVWWTHQLLFRGSWERVLAYLALLFLFIWHVSHSVEVEDSSAELVLHFQASCFGGVRFCHCTDGWVQIDATGYLGWILQMFGY